MTQRRQLKLESLTANAFAPFGDVVQTHGARQFSMNNNTFERYFDLAKIDVGTDSGSKVVVSIADCRQVSELPLRINMVEKHPLGSQLIYPLFSGPMIVVVAAPSEQFSLSSLKAFVSDGKQGVNYLPGTWHIPIVGLAPGQQFMIIDRGGQQPNCDLFYFDDQDHITLAAL